MRRQSEEDPSSPTIRNKESDIPNWQRCCFASTYVSLITDSPSGTSQTLGVQWRFFFFFLAHASTLSSLINYMHLVSDTHTPV